MNFRLYNIFLVCVVLFVVFSLSFATEYTGDIIYFISPTFKVNNSLSENTVVLKEIKNHGLTLLSTKSSPSVSEEKIASSVLFTSEDCCGSKVHIGKLFAEKKYYTIALISDSYSNLFTNKDVKEKYIIENIDIESFLISSQEKKPRLIVCMCDNSIKQCDVILQKILDYYASKKNILPVRYFVPLFGNTNENSPLLYVKGQLIPEKESKSFPTFYGSLTALLLNSLSEDFLTVAPSESFVTDLLQDVDLYDKDIVFDENKIKSKDKARIKPDFWIVVIFVFILFFAHFFIKDNKEKSLEKIDNVHKRVKDEIYSEVKKSD